MGCNSSHPAQSAAAQKAGLPASPPSKRAASIVIVGASGFVGKATVNALCKVVSGVKVATRNPDAPSSAAFREAGATVIPGDMNDVAGLTTAFEGAQTVFIIVPGHEHRERLGVNAIEAAKAAGVKHVVLQSISTADLVSTTYGRQFYPVEIAMKTSGIPFTILRLPLFTDNNWFQADPVKEMGKVFAPADADARFSTVTVSDVADAAVAVLANPAPHAGRTYNVAGPMYTHRELAAAFSSTLGKPVEYVQVPFEAAKKSFVDKGFPEWQAEGAMELYRAVNAGSYGYSSLDFVRLTGKEPQSIAQWVQSVKSGFQ